MNTNHFEDSLRKLAEHTEKFQKRLPTFNDRI